MQPHEIFARMPSDIAADLFTFLFEKEKALYKATVEALAKKRNLRPVFVERKPRAERFTWLQSNLGRPASSSIGAHLLQIWLVEGHGSLLCDFLDALGIEHDENGTVNELPPAPSEEALRAAIGQVQEKGHDPRVVTLYLHSFQALDDEGGWSTLAHLLESDPRFHLELPAA